MGARGDVRPVQRAGRARPPEPLRPGAREDLPRPDLELERPRDQGTEQEREPARPEDHARLPHRELRNDLQLHRLPRRRQRRLEVEGRHRPVRRLADRHRRERLAGVAGVVANTPGAHRYVDTAFALANKLHFAAIRNAAGKFVYPSIRRVVEAGATVKKVPAGNELHIVNPPKAAATAYPISTFTYIILPTRSSKAAELRKLVFWA